MLDENDISTAKGEEVCCFIVYHPQGTQGQSVGPGEMGQRKFSNTGGRAPGYGLSPDHFQTVKWILAPDWAQKNALYYCAQSANRFSWVRTRRLLSRHSCAVYSPSFLTRQRNYRWVEKCFGCYQREQFNLHWENSVSDGSQCIVNNRKFKMWRHRTRNKKQGKRTTLPVHHTLLYISLPSLQDYHVKMPSFTFCEGCKQAMSDKFSFS